MDKFNIYCYDFEVYSKINWFCVTFENYYNDDEVITIVNDENSLINFYNLHKNDIFVSYNGRQYDTAIWKSILAKMNIGYVNDQIIKYKKKPYQVVKNINKYQLYDYDAIIKDKSLKMLEAYMGDDIRETEVDFDIDRELTDNEIEKTIFYNRHDVKELKKVLKETWSDFEGQLDIVELYNVPLKHISKTKVQLASNILGAVQQHTLNDEFDIRFPSTLKLGEKYQHVLEWYKNPKNWTYKEHLHSFDSQHTNQYKCTIANVLHVFGFGGVHGSNDRKKIYEGIILALDVASQYPNIDIIYDLLSRKVSEPKRYKNMVDFRLDLKAKKDKRNNSLKPMINGVYGGSKDRNNPMYDPNRANLTCIFGQMLILDLIEKVEPYCELLQSNTDGIYIMVENEEMKQKVIEAATEWQNRTMLELEIDEYRKLIQKDVNNYIMIDKDGKYKSKGAYVKKLSPIDYDLPILNEALINYFVHDIPVEETVNNCNELIKFQKVIKLGNKYKEVLYGNGKKVRTDSKKDKIIVENGEVLKEKVHRLFASTRDEDKGIYKMKIEKGEKNYEKIANTPDKCFIDNTEVLGKTVPDYLDRQYYIDVAKERIRQFLETEEEVIDNTPNVLFECMSNANNYYEFLANCSKNKITKKVLESYLTADCCSMYGKTQKLLDFKVYFDMLYQKNKMTVKTVEKKLTDKNVRQMLINHSELSDTGKTYNNIDYEKLLLDIFEYIPNEHIHVCNILESQIKKFNECRYIDNTLEQDTYFVLNVRDVISPNVIVYNIKTGEYEYLKLDKQIYNILPLFDGDIFIITNKELCYEKKIVGKDSKGINILEDDIKREFYNIKGWKILYKHYTSKTKSFSESEECYYE